MKRKGLTKLACFALSAVLLVPGNGLLTRASGLALETEHPAAEDMQGTDAPASEETERADAPAAEDAETADAPAAEGAEGTDAPAAEDPESADAQAAGNAQDKDDQAQDDARNTDDQAADTSENADEDQAADAETTSVTVIDPLYAGELTDEELEELKASLEISTFALGRAAAKSCATMDEAVAYVRRQMVDRETAVTIQVPTGVVTSNGGAGKFADAVVEKAMEYSDSCTGQEGDALKWGRSGYGAMVRDLGTGNTQVAYTFGYHSSTEQEEELTTKVKEVLASLNLGGKSDYEKVRAIHDWICDHVDGETDTKNAARYSAYSAGCLGKAACQGYAVLFYRMCKEVRLPARIIGGTMNGGAHGWNLVYIKDNASVASAKSRELTGGAWYNVDCTADGQGSVRKDTYFLKADNAFPGHVRDLAYADFPKAEKSYLADGGKGWDLAPKYPSGPIIGTGPDGKPQSTPGAASNGGRLYRLGGGEYSASQDQSGKNKVYVFIQPSCPRSPGLANSLNSSIGRFSNTDIYLISTWYDDTKIRSFKNSMTNPNTALNFMYLGQALQDDWLNFTLDPAGKPITGDTPIVVYVDRNNKIQYATWGASTADAVRQNLDIYCSSSAESVQWNSITYHNLGGGVNHSENPPTYQAGVTVATLQSPTRDGYTFLGWYREGNYINEVTQITQSTSGNLNLYAKWEKQPAITYELDGGINDLHNPLFFNRGANEITLYEPIKNGYIFVGWYSDEAKTQKLADNKLVTTENTGDVMLYAKWTVGQPIQYVLNGGENDSHNRDSYKEGEEEFTLYDPRRPDYTFTGWYTDERLTNNITEITKTTTGALTLYAGWEHNPTDPANFPKVDMTLTEGNILMGIEGTYMTDTAEKILAELNRIRKEACDEGVKDGSDKTLTSADYVPLKWSAELEAIARLRAAEIAVRLDSNHKRPNGKEWNTAWTTTKTFSMGENLAARVSGTGIMNAITGWYNEKDAWVAGDRTSNTGHYRILISPEYKYAAISAFELSDDGYLPVTAALELSTNVGMDETKSEKAGFTVQDVEIAASAVTKLAFKEQSPLGLKVAGTADATVDATVEFKKGVDQILINRICTGSVRRGLAWKSSDESVAAVDANGVVTAKKAGTATITATVGGKSAELEVIVASDASDTPSTEKPGTGNPSAGNSGAGNPPADHPGTGNPPAQNPEAENPPAQNPEAENPPAQNPGAENPPAQNPGAETPPAQNLRAGNPPAAGPGMGNPPAENPAADETEKWNNVLAEVAAAKTGDRLRIDMKESPVVPGDVLTQIKGKEITVTLDMGSGITWSIDGKSITVDDIGDINLDVKIGTNAIPAGLVVDTAGDGDSLQLSLAHDGAFGFTGILSIDLGRERAGLTADLYYYDEKAKRLEPVTASAIADDGTAKFAFNHASDYLIVMRESGNVGSDDGDDGGDDVGNVGDGGDADGNVDSPYAGESKTPWGLFAACVMLLVAGIGAFIVIKKREG